MTGAKDSPSAPRRAGLDREAARQALERERAKHGAPQPHAPACDSWIIMEALDALLGQPERKPGR
jgi:hypothetical protein